MIGLGDNIGSGFPAILNAWATENWRKPDLSQNENLHQVELRLWTISLMPEECSEYLQRLFGSTYLQLNREEQIILGTAYLENSVTNSRLQSILELHSVDIGHLLSALVDKEMLVVNKKGRWTSYCLNRDYDAQNQQIDIYTISHEAPVLKNETDQIIYDYIKVNGFITAAQICSITRIKTSAGASKATKRLIEVGLVEKVRKGRSFIYQLKI